MDAKQGIPIRDTIILTGVDTGSFPDAKEPEEVYRMQDGDTFIEDTSECLGTIGPFPAPTPVELSIFIGGYYYIYKLDRREKQEETSNSNERKEEKK